MGRLSLGRGGGDGLDLDRVGMAVVNRHTVILSIVIIAVILISNLGAIWLLSL